jgi:glycosyltransferase involved in cell wall biosynthesis
MSLGSGEELTPRAQRLLVVSPVRNEERHIERTIRSMVAQTRPPDLWLVVDDDSGDRTLEILRRSEREIPYLEVIAAGAPGKKKEDRLALALEARAFNGALAEADLDSFTHVGKLDGDIELPADYFEKLLEEFAADPRLGIAGGLIEERTGRAGAWRVTRATPSHVQGALRVYSRDCFAAAGGVREMLGWDVIDQAYARMHGFHTASYSNLVARHHRVSGSANGRLRGRMRDGRCAYIARYSLGWVLMRSVKIGIGRRPYGVSAFAFLAGYLSGVAGRGKRVEDEAFKRFVRKEHRERILRRVRVEADRPPIAGVAQKADPARFVG